MMNSNFGSAVAEYNNEGLLTKVKTKRGYEVNYEHKDGKIVTYLSSNKSGKVSEFDDEGKLVSEKLFMFGNMVHENRTDGYKDFREYDDYGNCIHETDTEGKKIKREFCEFGLTHEKDYNGLETWMKYDKCCGKPVLEKCTSGVENTWKYDGYGNCVYEKYTKLGIVQKETWFTYNKNQKLIKARKHDNTQTEYEYNNKGELTNIIKSILNEYGLKIHEKHLSGLTVSYVYNEKLLIEKIQSDGLKVEYSYDDKKRLIKEVHSTGLIIVYEYTKSAEKTLVTYPDGRQEQSIQDKKGKRTYLLNPDGTKKLIANTSKSKVDELEDEYDEEEDFIFE